MQRQAIDDPKEQSARLAIHRTLRTFVEPYAPWAERRGRNATPAHRSPLKTHATSSRLRIGDPLQKSVGLRRQLQALAVLDCLQHHSSYVQRARRRPRPRANTAATWQLQPVAKRKPANDSEPESRLSRAFGFATHHWTQVLLAGSLASALIGWQVYDISLLQPLEELEQKQHVYREARRRSELQAQAVTQHLKLAQSFLDLGRLALAKHELEAAEKLDPGNPEARLGLLKIDVFEPVHDKNYVPEIAERRLNMILEQSPEDPHVLTFLGDVHSWIDEAAARSYYERAIAARPGAPGAYAGLAVMLDFKQRTDEAIHFYEMAVERSPWNQSYLNNLSYQYLLKRDAEHAVATDRMLLNLNGQYLLAYYSSSIAFRWLDQLEPARAYGDELLKLLADPEIHASECNRGHWFFHTDAQPVFFDQGEPPKRTYYAMLGAALTAHLRDDATRRDELLTSAAKLEGKGFDEVRRLVRYDGKVLTEQRPERKAQVDAYLALLEAAPAQPNNTARKRSSATSSSASGTAVKHKRAQVP